MHGVAGGSDHAQHIGLTWPLGQDLEMITRDVYYELEGETGRSGICAKMRIPWSQSMVRISWVTLRDS